MTELTTFQMIHSMKDKNTTVRNCYTMEKWWAIELISITELFLDQHYMTARFWGWNLEVNGQQHSLNGSSPTSDLFIAGD
jgi:hypothetical protein